MAAIPEPVDGRSARRARHHEAVVTAVLALIEEGNGRPTAQEVAERAGVSVRTVFRLFADLETLREIAIERHGERVAHLWEAPATDGCLEQRIEALVQARSRLFEAVGAVRRVAATVAATSPSIVAELDRRDRMLVDHLRQSFGPELSEADRSSRQDLLVALTVATSWETWDQLRTRQNCSAPVAARTVQLLLTRLLTPSPTGSSG